MLKTTCQAQCEELQKSKLQSRDRLCEKAGAPDVRRGIAEDEASMVSRGQVVESTVCKTKDFNFLA